MKLDLNPTINLMVIAQDCDKKMTEVLETGTHYPRLDISYDVDCVS